MTTWALDIQRGWRLGLVFVVGLVLLAAVLIVTVALNSLTILTFLLSLVAIAALAGAGVISYWLWGLVNASYTMDRNAVVIHWGGYMHQIPLAEIREVLRGSEVEGLRLQSLFCWPGYLVGRGSAPALGQILFYATQPLDAQLILRAESGTYAISPIDREGFITAFSERMELGATQDVTAVSTHPAFLDWPIWQDQMALGLWGSSLVVLALLVAGLCGLYPFLPPEIPLQITREGEILRMTGAGRIFYFALLGVLFLLVNGGAGMYFYQRERDHAIAYFFWSGTLLLQGSLWVAAVAVLLNL